MDELIQRIVAAVGVEPAVAEKAIGIIFDFLMKDGPSDKVQGLVDAIPGAAAALEKARADAGGGGMFNLGGVMGAGSRLMGLGLGMGDVQGVTREVMGFAREKAGEDKVAEIVAAVPGLSQFV
ncbi:MAG TPA: DUF2267 domain-containing protein [Xanthobacteraceae bacterium]|nr:DUF2267 domain-containing protein [Xanthobacteraceae bacterium]